jgi:hypothetical protein
MQAPDRNDRSAMPPARKQTPRPKAAAEDTTDQVENVVAQIRELNEQVLARGRELGLGFLSAYEQTVRAVADLETKAAESAQVDWIADIARAQAEFLRKVTDTYVAATRDLLER